MESIGGDLRAMSPKPFEPEQLSAMRKIGRERSYRAGEMITGVGDRTEQFMLLLDGEVEVTHPVTGERIVPSTLRSGQFVGELNFLNGGSGTLPMRAAADTLMLEVPRLAMLDLMAKVPEIGDHILTVFSARRRLQFEEGRSALTVVGADRDHAVQSVASFLSRNRIPFQSFELNADGEEAAFLLRAAGYRPAVLTNNGSLIDDPSPRKVAALLGLAIGGQAGTSSRIENYMGFPTGISGADLVYRGQIQAMKFGTRFVMPRRVISLAQVSDGFCATLDDGETVCARSVLVATGVQYRRIPVDRLEDFEGAGVYYAATEMEARFCQGTEAVVVGGGNSAGQAAMYLSRAAQHVHLLVRGRSLAATMSSYRPSSS
jgi:thioredoxin reductase (NADPH)